MKFNKEPEIIIISSEDEDEVLAHKMNALTIGRAVAFPPSFYIESFALSFDQETELDQRILKRQPRSLSNKKKSDDLLLYAGSIPLRRRELDILLSGTWINDEIINAYLHHLSVAFTSRQNFIFSTFFYARLFGDQQVYHYKQVKKWTKSESLDAFHNIIVPINHGNFHWALACIRIQEKTFSYYDSIPSASRASKVLKNLRQYMMDETTSKSLSFPVHEFKTWKMHEEKCARQNDGSSCGIFVCLFATAVASGMPIRQVKTLDAVVFRRKLAYILFSQKEAQPNEKDQ